jgi:predicted CopG family antitoxin
MARKVTISVPEDLYEKMSKWRDSFNFSNVFQRAISTLIQKKEDFQSRIQQELDQSAIIERLREEKSQSENNYYDVGRKDGVKWAKSAHYDDLQYAMRWVPDEKPTQDRVLGDFFAKVIAKDDIMDYAVGSDPVCVNEFVKTYIDGWKEGVKDFWQEIKEKL